MKGKPKRPKRKRAVNRPETLLRRVLRKGGTYYQSGELFYQRLWRQRLQAIGFRVHHVERLEPQPVWNIRLTGSLTAQAYLLLSRPAKRWIFSPHLQERQLQEEIRQLAQEMGPPINSKNIHVSRGGNYWRVSFVWEAGQPGTLLLTHEKFGPFSDLIQPWLHQVRN